MAPQFQLRTFSFPVLPSHSDGMARLLRVRRAAGGRPEGRQPGDALHVRPRADPVRPKDRGQCHGREAHRNADGVSVPLARRYYRCANHLVLRCSDDDEVGIEMQVLGEGRVSTTAEHRSEEISSAQSAISFEFQYPPGTSGAGTSTGPMDFKVDVHRKNSSESSDSVAFSQNTKNKSSLVVAEVCENDDSVRAGATGSQSRDAASSSGLVNSNSSKRRSQKKKRDSPAVKHKSKKPTRDSSSSSAPSSSGGESRSSESSSTGTSTNDRIYKYETSSSSSSSRSERRFSANTKSSSVAHGGAGKQSDKPEGTTEGVNKSDPQKKRKKKRNSVDRSAETEKASSVSLPQHNVTEVDSESVQDKSSVSTASGAKKKKLPVTRLQRQVSDFVFYYLL